MNLLTTITEEQRIHMLTPPQKRDKKIRMVLDTDAFNEIDDQFAVAYALLAKDRISLEALYAAPFFNSNSSGPADGMEKSYEELIQILKRLGQEPGGLVFRGSSSYLSGAQTPVSSPAALDLVERARSASPDSPLYVTAIGAITNVASALLLAPDIANKIVIVWLGGHALYWKDTREFNLWQDPAASRVVLDSGVPLLLIPCLGVADHLITTLPEINAHVRGKGEIGDFLASRYESCRKDHFGASRVIWDISAVACLACPDSISTELIHSPILTEQGTWSFDTSRHFIRCASSISRDMVFQDLFQLLDLNKK